MEIRELVREVVPELRIEMARFAGGES